MDRSRLAIEMFDKALALEPENVLLHSNRGLACFFANRPEEAMMEWQTVSRLDPAYVKRRGSAVQKEYDETAVTFVDINIPERAIQLPARTADFLYQLSPGYDTDEWDIMVTDKSLDKVPEYIRDARRIERNLQALQL
jgi:tetratricopeptide (TPR) repeat protein